MKRIALISVIALTNWSLVSVSAQRQVSGYALPVQNRDSVVLSISDSERIRGYVNISQYYLAINIDSAIYWSEKAISFSLTKNNSGYLKYALQARQKIVQYALREKQHQNFILNQQLELQQKRSGILIIAAFIILLTSIYFAILYKQKNIVLKRLQNFNADIEEKNMQLVLMNKETEEKNIQLLHQQKETQENIQEPGKINSIKDKLIPMIAHDIRSPLASLQNTLSLTRENILNPEEFQKLSFALEADIYNLRGMLDNMLLWAREQIVEIKIDTTQFNLSEMVQHVILMHRNNLITKNIHIHNYLQPDVQVFSDKEMMTAVFRNIISNAVKFTPQNKSIYIHQIFLNKKIYISVKDEGSGISEETLEKLNNKEHISTRGTANEKGTGIGIFFTKDLLSKLDEVFDITAVPGQGTSVTFSISFTDDKIQTPLATEQSVIAG